MSVAVMNTSITLTTTAQSLYSLLAAINPNAMRNCAVVEIQGDDANVANYIIGDSRLATNNYSYSGQNAGDFYKDESSNDINNVSLTVLYIRAVSGTPTIHVKIRTV